MEKLKIDYELSRKVFDKYKKLVKLKECYNNCYNIATNAYELGFYHKKLKLGYCYVDIGFYGVLIRHCVLLTEDNKVIDVTALLTDDKERLKARNYYLFDSLDDDGVFEMVVNTGYADNIKSKTEAVEYKNIVKDSHYTINEYDFYRYIFPKISKLEEEKL